MKVRMLTLCLALVLVGCSIGSSTPRELADEPAAPTSIPLAAATATTQPEATTTSSPTPSAAATTETTTATTEISATPTAASETTPPPAATQVVAPPQPVTLPPGFGISVYAEDLGHPRFMAYSPEGVLHVTDQSGGRVLALPDANGDGVADERQIVVSGLNRPHGITFHERELYVGETNQIVKFERAGDGWGDKIILVPDLPTRGHGTRTVIFGQDGNMYVSIGSSCNVCNEQSTLRAAVWQYEADGSNGRLYTRGLRNAVGLVTRPGTDEIWATNNGRDMLGDDLPPETINVLADGADFGWPRCHAGRLVDPDFGDQGGCEGAAPPIVEMQAHSAPLGLRFYDGQMFPADYQGNLFVAFHGSWNRSEPTGYKVVRIAVDAAGKPGEVQDFASGWLEANGESWGRPVDVIVAPDGSLMVSDDAGGRIYRIFYQG
ncbi:MAG TPA: PQQ-dependent sugar dehydrogenase [Herpetosiphonaceae bacterium]